MENYHIYEEIGRGKYSVVYKGRRKKSIAYVAIKSVDKDRMNKILNEVQILHKLDSPYTLKFHNWYESRNHIWLILEYCTGGDLLKLIIQDVTLPERVIKRFGYDLIKGMQYLHTSGILYCDLKPANVIIDEFGVLKLSDFGLARYIPTTTNIEKLELKRGTPHYMAPELFEEEGIHSFASDFWALGCVLYELRRGKPPFTHTSFNELVHQIVMMEAPIAHDDQDISVEFKDILRKLLTKDPSKRMTWNELRTHPFWNEFPELPKEILPEQPLYESFIQRRRIQHKETVEHSIVETNPSPPQSDSESPKNEISSSLDMEKYIHILKHNQQLNDNSSSYRGSASSLANPSEEQDIILDNPNIQLDFADRTKNEELETPQVVSKSSHHSRRNSSGGDDGYKENNVHPNKICSGSDGYGGSNGYEGNDVLLSKNATGNENDNHNGINNNDPNSTYNNHNHNGIYKNNNPNGGYNGGYNSNHPNGNGNPNDVGEKTMDIQGNHSVGVAVGVPKKNDMKPQEKVNQRPFSAPIKEVSKQPYKRQDTLEGEEDEKPLAFQTNWVQIKEENHFSKDLTATRIPKTAPVPKTVFATLIPGTSSTSTVSLQYGNSEIVHEKEDYSFLFNGDATVKHIVCNKEIEQIPAPSLMKAYLPFEAYRPNRLLTMPTQELENFLNEVFQQLVQAKTIQEKLNLLGYLYTLCLSAKIANILVNTSIVPVLLDLLHQGTDNTLKCCLVLIIGLLIRFAIVIHPEFVVNDIAKGLRKHLRDSNDLLRRRSVACLGELLFYSSMKASEGGDVAYPLLPSSTTTCILQCLEDEDEIIRYYAAKCVENVTTLATNPYYLEHFATAEVALILIHMGKTSEMESLRATCFNGVAHVIRRAKLHFNKNLIVDVFAREGCLAYILREINSEGNVILTKGYLNILNMLLCCLLEEEVSSTLKNTRHFLMDDHVYVPLSKSLVNLIEHPSDESLRPKSLMFLFFMMKINRLFALQCCDNHLPVILERIMVYQASQTERNGYLLQCVSSVSSLLVDLAYNVLSSAVQELDSLCNTSPILSPQIAGFPVVLHVLNSSFLWKKLQNHNMTVVHSESNEEEHRSADLFLTNLSILLKELAKMTSLLIMDFRGVVLKIAAKISEKSNEFMKTSHMVLVVDFLPSLACLLGSNNNRDDQLLSLRMLINLVENFSIYSQEEEEKLEEDALWKKEQRLIDICMIEDLLPKMEMLLVDEVLRELALVLIMKMVQRNVAFVGILHRLNLVEKIVGLLSNDIDVQSSAILSSSTLNVTSIKLVHLIIESQEIPMMNLFHIGLVVGISKAFKYAEKRKMWPCLDQLLSLLYSVLYYVSLCVQPNNGKITNFTKIESENYHSASSSSFHHPVSLSSPIHHPVSSSSNSPAAENAMEDGQVVVLKTQHLTKCTSILIRLCVTVEQNDESDRLGHLVVSIGEASAKCMALMGQLYNTRFFDAFYLVGLSKPTTPRRSNLRYLLYALDTNNETIQLRLLKILRYSLRVKAPYAYATCIVNSRGLWEKLKCLIETPKDMNLQRNSLQEKDTMNTISTLALDICNLVRMYRTKH